MPSSSLLQSCLCRWSSRGKRTLLLLLLYFSLAHLVLAFSSLCHLPLLGSHLVFFRSFCSFENHTLLFAFRHPLSIVRRSRSRETKMPSMATFTRVRPRSVHAFVAILLVTLVVQYACLSVSRFVTSYKPVYQSGLVYPDTAPTRETLPPWSCRSECFPSAFNATEFHCANCFQPAVEEQQARPPIFEPEVMCNVLSRWHAMAGIFSSAQPAAAFVCNAALEDILLAWFLRMNTYEVYPAQWILTLITLVAFGIQMLEVYRFVKHEADHAKQADLARKAAKKAQDMKRVQQALVQGVTDEEDEASEAELRHRHVVGFH
jgi:hypothetical protein